MLSPVAAQPTSGRFAALRPLRRSVPSPADALSHARARALRLRLFHRYSLQQADVLKEDHVPEALRGGRTSVDLRHTKDRSPCTTKSWMHTLGHAGACAGVPAPIAPARSLCPRLCCALLTRLLASSSWTTVTTNFECSYYFCAHTARGGGRATCRFTFYGIATNASLAAFAFAAAFNRVASLSAAHAVPADEYESKRRRGLVACTKGVYTTAARESYRTGLAVGLHEAVDASKREKEERAQRRLELARAKASRGEAWQESDDDDWSDGGGDVGGHGGGGGGGDDSDEGDDARGDDGGPVETEALEGLSGGRGKARLSLSPTGGGVKSEGGGAATESEETATTSSSAAEAVVKLEKQQQSALALVAHTKKVGEAVLEEAGVKLSGRAHTYTSRTVHRPESFVQGKADSKEIDINQRSITGPKSKMS